MHPPLVLHGDRGSPLKAGSVLALMHVLGITPSHSRPRVSNGNPHAGADAAILARRAEVYRAAKARHPERWNGRSTRNWSPVRSITLNPVSQRSLEPIAKRAA